MKAFDVPCSRKDPVKSVLSQASFAPSRLELQESRKIP
jgi:hypothetical protein